MSSPDRPRKFIKAEWLGKGGFATCFRVIEVSKEKKQYACKIIDKKDFQANDPREKQHADNRKLKLQREVKIQKLLQHEHLVRLVHHFEDLNNIYLILDLCPNQSLHDLVQRRQGGLTEVEVRYFMKQMIEAVDYMMSKQILHRDLKVGNTFIDKQRLLKVSEFDISVEAKVCSYDEQEYMNSRNYISVGLKTQCLLMTEMLEKTIKAKEIMNQNLKCAYFK